MKHKLLMACQYLLNFLKGIRKRIDDFERKEEALYWADPKAYCRRTDWFWARVAIVLGICIFLAAYWGSVS